MNRRDTVLALLALGITIPADMTEEELKISRSTLGGQLKA